jgi:hypothetical protein
VKLDAEEGLRLGAWGLRLEATAARCVRVRGARL